ncbi:MAG: nucleotide sugar dehydrogenase [Myxococcota bacterium]|nr:nucleotide sugar dehydrogenase [Myxococcota bacterium]
MGNRLVSGKPVTDDKKKATPLAQSGFARSSFDKVAYNKQEYAPSTFTQPEFVASDYVSSATMKETLIGKINIKDATVAVIGLGYVGLPLAVEMAQSGFSVIGVDIDTQVVEGVNLGNSHVGDVPTERLAPLVASGRIRASGEYAAVKDADCISICVPTPLRKTKEPDITCITDAVDRVIPSMGPGKLVVLESTTYPGTTEELIAERLQTECGLKVGETVFVAFSPERVDPGNTKWQTKNTPKVLGGVTPACTEVAKALYSAVVDRVHAVGSAREAETVKLLENTFRAVNIGLVNEFMLMCDRLDIDIWNVIEAASTKPFGYMPFFPGPGIGGHCIPLDPMYMSWKAKAVDFYNRFIELATDINGNMPRFVLAKLADLLNDREKSLKGSRVMILGMAYKANVGDLRESPGLEIYRLLRQKGAWVEFNDPHADSFVSILGNVVQSSPIDGDALSSFDAALLVTDHDAFDYKTIADKSPLILDCRNAFARRGISKENVYKL